MLAPLPFATGVLVLLFSSAEVFAGGVTSLVIAVGVLLQPGALSAGRWWRC